MNKGTQKPNGTPLFRGSKIYQSSEQIPNGLSVFAPSLIGAKCCINTISPRSDIITEIDGWVSVDMVRLRLHFRPKDYEKLFNMTETFQCDDGSFDEWVATPQPGKYRKVSRYRFDGTGVSLGLGLFKKNCGTDNTKGYLEFNPNKLGENSAFKGFLKKIARYVKSVDLVRWDLAVDWLTSPKYYRLIKDKRDYELHLGAVKTEYLGQRNRAGRVKLYDKRAEIKQKEGIDLGVDLMRLELTCGENDTLEKIQERLPEVRGLHSLELPLDEIGGLMKVVVALLNEKVANGCDVNQWLTQLNFRTRKKIKELVFEPPLDVPEKAIYAAMNSAANWANLEKWFE